MKTSYFALFFLLIALGASAQKQNLRLNLKTGETYRQDMTADMSIKQKVNDQQIDISMLVKGKMAFKVNKFLNDNYEMDVLYESLSLSMNMPNGKMEMDSESKEENDVFAKIMKSLTNKTFQMQMTRTGKVTSVNVDNLFDGVFAQLPELDEAKKQQLKNSLMQVYGESAFKGNIEMLSAIFPENPVAKGDSWKINTQLESGMSANIGTTYTLDDVNSSQYLVSGISNISTDDKSAYTELNGMSMRYDVTGTMKSTIKVNKSTGWTQEAVISQQIKGNIYFKDSPEMPGGMVIPMELNSNMRVVE